MCTLAMFHAYFPQRMFPHVCFDTDGLVTCLRFDWIAIAVGVWPWWQAPVPKFISMLSWTYLAFLHIRCIFDDLCINTSFIYLVQNVSKLYQTATKPPHAIKRPWFFAKANGTPMSNKCSTPSCDGAPNFAKEKLCYEHHPTICI